MGGRWLAEDEMLVPLGSRVINLLAKPFPKNLLAFDQLPACRREALGRLREEPDGARRDRQQLCPHQVVGFLYH